MARATSEEAVQHTVHRLHGYAFFMFVCQGLIWQGLVLGQLSQSGGPRDLTTSTLDACLGRCTLDWTDI